MRLRKMRSSGWRAGLLYLGLFCACKKPDIGHSTTMQTFPNTTSTPVSSSDAPIVVAGPDQVLYLPVSAIYLNGTYTAQNTLDKVLWRPLSGLGSVVVSSGSLNTYVYVAQPGVYEFELMVKDKANLVGRDTVMVTVLPDPSSIAIAPDSVLFLQYGWISPWYYAVEVKNINAYIPPGKSMRVYIRREQTPNWLPVSHIPLDPSQTTGNPYEYFVETRPDGAGMYSYGSLYIFYYGYDVSDRPDVKIEFF